MSIACKPMKNQMYGFGTRMQQKMLIQIEHFDLCVSITNNAADFSFEWYVSGIKVTSFVFFSLICVRLLVMHNIIEGCQG